MYNPGWNMKTECRDAEEYLLNQGRDFSAVYMTVSNLVFIAKYRANIFTDKTVQAIEQVLVNPVHRAQRQSYFLYRKAAEVFSTLITRTPEERMANLARKSLISVLHRTQGPAFRATCEAMGALPLPIEPAATTESGGTHICNRNWQELLSEIGLSGDIIPAVKGRNLIFTRKDGHLLVLKTTCSKDDVPKLSDEISWMNHLRLHVCNELASGAHFRVPCPAFDKVLQLDGLPEPLLEKRSGSQCFAAGFTASSDYFTYPNESIDHPPITHENLDTNISRNARLLGELTASGIIHTAPIPLFHNRVQSHRRTDQGVYQWHRGGRLDRWLESCRYPNIGMTGIRDFEHFVPFDNAPRRLYIQIGTHILSLVLIAGSYFRNQSPDLFGKNPDGTPVDARHLFDKPLFRRILHNIFSNYYIGFTGTSHVPELPVDSEVLTDRLIDELGVDRHMEEVLRVADQQEMNRHAFEKFLAERGFSRSETAGTKQGAADIVIQTGPHLGDFNDRISIPELIEYTAASAAMCITGRFFNTRFPFSPRQ